MMLGTIIVASLNKALDSLLRLANPFVLNFGRRHMYHDSAVFLC